MKLNSNDINVLHAIHGRTGSARLSLSMETYTFADYYGNETNVRKATLRKLRDRGLIEGSLDRPDLTDSGRATVADRG